MGEYGFLLGFGLGWLPSAMLAGIVALAVRWLWLPGIIAVIAFAAGGLG